MATIQEKLDAALVEIEKLKAECEIKAETSENFKRAYNEQLIKTRGVNSDVDKLTLELSVKEEELSAANQTREELKSSLKDKEAAVKCLSAANDRLKADGAEKIKKLEDENRKIGLALDEANETNVDQKREIESLGNEVERLRELVVALQRTSSEVEKRTNSSKELRQRDDVLLKLEEEKMKFEEQLKWKKEQFAHLVEAHEKIKQLFREKEKEWESEKNALFDEISTLQTDLDSQTRTSEGLQTRLLMCNQALAHEESRRKLLEAQLSEAKSCFDYVPAECEETNSRIDRLTNQRDTEKDLDDEHKNVAMLNLIEEEQLSLQIEVDVLKEKLKEASTYQEHLEEQVVKTKSELKEAREALERANEELAENLCEGKEIGFELQLWRSTAEQLKSSLDENHRMRQEVEASLVAQVDVELELRWEKNNLEHILANKENETNELKEQIALLNEKLRKRETNVSDIHEELDSFEEEWMRKEMEKAIVAKVEAEKKHKKEEESLRQRIDDLQAETDTFHKTWESVREAVVLKEIEIQEKDMLNFELENDINSLQREVEQQNREMQLSKRIGTIVQTSDC